MIGNNCWDWEEEKLECLKNLIIRYYIIKAIGEGY